MKADTDVAELDAGVANLKMIDTDDEEEDEEEEESSSDEEGQVVEMSEDEDDAVADTNSLTETSFEGVEYLEDEDTNQIYSLKGQHVGKWTSDFDGIVFVNDKFKQEHEEKCGKSFLFFNL